MYKFVSLYHRPRYVTGRWKLAKTSGDERLLDIPGRYGEVVLVLGVTGDTIERSIQFEKLRLMPEYVNAPVSTTLIQFLESLGEMTLDFDKERFTINPVYATYRLLSNTDLKIEPIDRYDSPKNTGGFSKSDLYVETIKKGEKNLGAYGLFSVNGFYHLSDYDENGIYIHDGNRSVRRANDNQVGVTCFENVGLVKQFPITDSMISSGTLGVSLRESTFVSIPEDIAIDGYSFFIVIGGYIYPISDGIRRVSTRSFRLSLARLDLITRYYDAKASINMDSLPLTDYEEKDEGLVSVDEFYSDDVIRALLKLPQSFIVMVKNPHMFFNTEPADTPLPGTVLIPYQQFAHKPLMGVNGRHIEYIPVMRNDMVTCYCEYNFSNDYLYNYRLYRKQGSTDTKKYSFEPFRHQQYHILNIGADR